MFVIKLIQVKKVYWTRESTKFRFRFFYEKGLNLINQSIYRSWLLDLNWFLKKIIFRGLPSSFKGQHGFICYYVNASIVDDQEMEPLLKTKSINVAVQSGIRKPDLLVIEIDLHNLTTTTN